MRRQALWHALLVAFGTCVGIAPTYAAYPAPPAGVQPVAGAHICAMDIQLVPPPGGSDGGCGSYGYGSCRTLKVTIPPNETFQAFKRYIQQGNDPNYGEYENCDGAIGWCRWATDIVLGQDGAQTTASTVLLNWRKGDDEAWRHAALIAWCSDI